LERGAIPNPPAVKVRGPLFWAASGCHDKVASHLLDHEEANGLYSNPADNQAVFNEAVEKGSVEIMRMVWTRREVILNSRNQYNTTPLQSAAKKGHKKIIKFLIEEGALLDDHAQGDEALIAAASAGHLDVVKILCCKGKISPNVFDGNGRSPLSCAASSRDSSSNMENGLEMAKFLLSKGADPNHIAASDGPLHQAAMQGHIKMVGLLVEHGADPMRDINGWSPLTNALRYKSPGTIKLLLEAKVSDDSARKAWLDGALRYACRTGERGIVLQLLEAGANINAVEENGIPKGASPLLLAILHGHVKTAQLLVRRGARQDLADEKGRLALPLAADDGYEVLVRDLVRAGGEVDLKSGDNQDTPLILAAAKGHVKVVKCLLENGADKEVENKFGDMALDVAEEKGHEDIIKLLEQD
jgi:ankyrin repeat protein